MRRERGMTLVELVTTMLVLGILTAIAIPSYTSYMRKARRADAKVALTSSAQLLERCYTRFNAYNPLPPAAACVALPYNTPNNTYTIDADNGPLGGSVNPGGILQNTFTLKATPLGYQAKDTHCGTFLLNSLNQQTVTAGATDCW
jgi:type IV pilus assembly protein PilE